MEFLVTDRIKSARNALNKIIESPDDHAITKQAFSEIARLLKEAEAGDNPGEARKIAAIGEMAYNYVDRMHA